MSWSERSRDSSRGSLRSSRQALHDDGLDASLIENWKELGQLLLHPCIALAAAAEDVFKQVLTAGGSRAADRLRALPRRGSRWLAL